MNNLGQWEEIKRIFTSALELDADRRHDFIRQACGTDAEMLREVESLLAREQQAEGFIEQPALDIAARDLAGRGSTGLGAHSLPFDLLHYRVMEKIGQGGMGIVYRAIDTRLNRPVAIKALPEIFSADPERLARFEREARATALLNHPNILAIFDIGTHEGSPYIVSELLRGSNLRELQSGRPLAPRKAVEYALQIAKGLAAAHERGIVHRDLKPENVFVTHEGIVKILDFGLAKLGQQETGPGALEAAESLSTKQGQVLGTAGYMSPEQVRGQPVDARSDLFAFGAVLYEMFSGKRAFRGNTTADTLSAILNLDPPDLAETGQLVPPALERTVRHCLEKNPDQRFQSARDVVFALETLSTISEAAQHRIEATTSRRRPAIPLLGGVLVLCVLALAYLGIKGTADRPLPDFHRLTYRRGTVRQARFMPDGQNVLYTAAWDKGNPSVYSTRFDSTESSPLPWDNTEILSISARGELALLSKLTSNALEDNGTLAIASSMASAPRELETSVTFADWGPDGSELALIRHTPKECVLEFPRGNVISRKGPKEGIFRYVRVSPKGDLLAVLDYAGVDDGYAVILDRKGSRKAQSPLYGAIMGCAWSPDGRKVWYTANGGSNHVVYEMDLSGKVRLVMRVPGVLTLKDVSRQGLVLLCRDDYSGSLMYMGRGDKTERNLAWYNQSLLSDLSADGQTMIFNEGGAATEEKWGTYLRKTDGSPAVRLGDYLGGKLSPDGKWVLAGTQFGAEHDALFLLPTGAGAIRQVTEEHLHTGGAFSWLPDSSGFVFPGQEQGKGERTYLQLLNGSKVKPVTPEGMRGWLVTPDGKFLVVRDSPKTGLLYPIGGGEPQGKLQGFMPGDWLMRWHADGKRLFVWRGTEESFLIFLLDPYSGKREPWRQITPTVSAGPAFVGPPYLSADGECYAYFVNHILSELYVVSGVH